MVGLMKSALRKAVGYTNLTYKRKEVLITVEVTFNNRPLGYLEDDVELPPLTPNGFYSWYEHKSSRREYRSTG